MKRTALPLFEGFIETPFEQRFQGLLRQAWKLRRWHVIVAEPGSGKTMGIRDLSAQASRELLWDWERGGDGANANICCLSYWCSMASSAWSSMMPMICRCLTSFS